MFSYPSSFIETEFRKYFFDYASTSSFVPFIVNDKQFSLLRQKQLDIPTPPQSQVASSILTDNIDENQPNEVSTEPKKTNAKHKLHYSDRIIIHYTHEKRFQSFKRDTHHIYDDVFKNTPASYVKLIVGNRNRRDLAKNLIRKRPKRAILQNRSNKSEYFEQHYSEDKL